MANLRTKRIVLGMLLASALSLQQCNKISNAVGGLMPRFQFTDLSKSYVMPIEINTENENERILSDLSKSYVMPVKITEGKSHFSNLLKPYVLPANYKPNKTERDYSGKSNLESVNLESRCKELLPIVQDAVNVYDIPISWVFGIMDVESGCNPVVDDSHKGAIGPMQLMPNTAYKFGVEPNDLRGNIFGGVALLSYLEKKYNGNLDMILAAYFAGEKQVAKHNGIPPTHDGNMNTSQYVSLVKKRIQKYEG